MRKINAKLLLGLLLGSIFCSGAVFGVHHFQYRRIADSLLWQARRAEEQGQVRRQAKYLQRYLEFNPKDLDGKATLAKLWAGDAFAGSARERQKAARLLDEVLTRGDEKPELRRVLVKAALEVQMVKLARNHLEKLVSREFLAAPSEPAAGTEADPERGEVEGYAGQLLEAENQPAKALICYRLAVRHAPQVRITYVLLAELLRRQKEIDPARQEKNEAEANQTIDKLVENNRLAYEAYLARWGYRREHGLLGFKKELASGQVSLKDAAGDVAEALQRAPESVDVLLAAADLERLQAQALLAAEGDPAERKGRDEHRDRALAYLNQALKLHARGGRPALLDLTQFQLLWHKGGLLLDDVERLDARRSGETTPEAAERREGLVAETTQLIEQIRKTRGSPSAADYLKARLLLQDRRWAEAVALFEQARPALATQPDLANQINLYLGQCYEQLVEPGQMLMAYERLHQAEPNSVAARLGMAQAEWTMGHLDKASEKFRELATEGRLPEKVWLDFARLEIQRQSHQDKPNWQAVEKVLDYAAKANPKSVDVPLMNAQMWFVRGDWKKARSTLKEAQEQRDWTDSVELWTARIHLELRDKKTLEEARTILREAKRKLGDRVVLLRLAEARLLAEEDPKGSESAIARLADDAEQFKKEEEQARLLSGLADVQLNQENVQAARELWQRVAKLPSHRTDLPLHLLLFDLAVKAEDEDAMRQTLDDIRERESSQGPFHRYGEALRLIWQAKKRPQEQQKSLDEARIHLDRVQSIRPTWPPVFLARAQVERMIDHPDQAISNLQKAVEYGERSPAVIRDLVELLANRERYDEADAALRYLHEPLLAHSDLGKLATVLASHRKDQRRAWELFNKNRAAEGTTNYRELLWEGRMLAESNRPEAEEKLRAALRLAEREPEPYLALVQYLVRQKRDKDADAVLEQARKRLPAERVELTLGQCYELLGRNKSARARYEEALSANREDATVLRRVAGFYITAGQTAEAEPLLRDLVEGRVRNPSADDVKWARRHFALVLASGTDYGHFREALELVGLKLDASGQLLRDAERERAEGSDERRFQARVLATQAAHRHFRQRALELLEELERAKALPTDDRFILAMLYETGGSWLKAKPLLLSVAGERQREPAPRHLAYFVQTLLDHKELEEAEKMVERLEQLEEERGPDQNAFAAVELRARLEELRGKGDVALKRLDKLVRRPKANPAEVLLVLNSMRRQGKFAEALERCTATWQEKKCPPETIGGASVAVLRHMQMSGKEASHAQVLLVENHLKDALKDNPKSVALMLHLADLFDQRGRWEEAEALYRQVLRPEIEPKNVVALNNLAWLLAQRASDRRKVEEALTRIESAVNGIGRRADLIDTRGLVYLKLEQNAAALADFREAAADMPTPAHLFHLARVHQQMHDKANAFKVFKQAKEHGLQASALHPVEHDAYQRLLKELNVN